MIYKDDWEKAKNRFKAWWEGEIIDRPVIQITAPRKGVKADSSWDGWNLMHNFANPEMAILEFEKYCRQTYFGGESFPNLWVNFGPGVMAAYIGAEPKIGKDTVWFETPKELEQIFQEVRFDSNNKWWNITKNITSKAVEMCNNKFFVGMTDIGGDLDIVASLRGAQNLIFDLVDSPDKVKEISENINKLWRKYYEELNGIIQKKMKGTSAWMGIWAPGTWYPLQCDFSAMISPKMFEEFVTPYLRKQCQWLDYSIYHWDGPGQIPHLEFLLDIPELNGIQWVPGAGNPGVGSPKWFPLYRRIQDKGKLLVLQGMAKENIEQVMDELSPRGLLISMGCNSGEEAKEVLRKVEKWTKI
jgi:5-methyltetrahydrofolate--homocysteine methyltransferase